MHSNPLLNILQIFKQFENVKNYEVFDDQNNGEVSFRIEKEDSEELLNIGDIPKDYSPRELLNFSELHTMMKGRVSETNAQLADARRSLQKQHSKLANELKFLHGGDVCITRLDHNNKRQ